MSVGTVNQVVRPSQIDSMHPLCRGGGEFAAIVFCGDVRLLGELAGEPTAHTPWKFVLPDSTIEAKRDFARVPGMLLPRWEREVVGPLNGVCFAFTSAGHPALRAIAAAGGVQDEHFVLLGTDAALTADQLHRRLERFIAMIPSDGAVAILGYGHQGSDIAIRLRNRFDFASGRILIHEANADSQSRVKTDGFQIVAANEVMTLATGVIYSPLMRHERLHRLLAEADASGLPVLDNSRSASGLQQFISKGKLRLDGAASRCLAIHHERVSSGGSGLPLRLNVIREDSRLVSGVTFSHLHGGYRFQLDADGGQIDFNASFAADPLPTCTRREPKHAYLSIHDRADLGFFAARELGLRLWPAATREVFAAQHVCDLGGTSFERLLQGHLDAREVASTMQTPAQRAMLGIVARQYAPNRPIVEIGSAFGGSALLMAAATDQGRPPIHSIDPETSTRDIMRFAFQREGHLDRLHQLITTSGQAIGQLGHLRSKVGLVFIDGLHTHAGVEADFNAYAPLVAPGGAILFHDVAPQIEPVMRFVMSTVLADSRFRIMCLVDGLAVFERRA